MNYGLLEHQAKKIWREAWAEGYSEGEAITKRKRDIEIIKNLRNLGASTEFIAKATGLTIAEVENL